MRVRWTADAVEDLERICDDIAEDRPMAASRVAGAATRIIASLAEFPLRGRVGRVVGTRELVLPGLPFLAIYEVDEDVRVLRILHGAQRWPSGV